MEAKIKFRRQGERTAKTHQRIQRQGKQRERGTKPERVMPMQAGARKYPAPPLPGKMLKKPGKESSLSLEPMYDAPFYRGSGKLEDQVAIITGGDSGIGRSVAVLFAREGADVAIVYLSEHEDARLTKSLVEKEGRNCILIPGDVTDKTFCQFAVKQTLKEFSRLDVLVNNAAFQLHAADMDELSEAHFDLTLKTNLYGYFHMTKAAVTFMNRGGAIVNNGSVTGLFGNKNLLDYSLTKGGIHAWTRSLGNQLIKKGIRVNAVAPGPVWTPLNPSDKKSKDIKRFGADTPMKRPAQPEEIAPAFVFLASSHCSSYITGEILPVIGGYSGA